MIDVHEHHELYNRESDAIRKETDKFHDTILVEMMTLSFMLHSLGWFEKKDSKINEH